MRLLTSLFAMMAMVGMEAQPSAELPRLVVNILVDQLRTDYMEAFAPLYADGGFKRLMDEARYYSDAQSPFRGTDRASASACVSTGAIPYDNGIPALSWLSRKTLQPVFCVDDSKYAGHRTDEKTSASALLTTTLSDELKIATGQKSVVYSIAPEREIAVLLAGHAADGAFWINDQTGAWCGSSCYGDFPYWASSFDRDDPLSSRVKKLSWEPVYDGGLQSFHYFQSVTDAATLDFKHRFEGDRRFRLFKTSGMCNEEIQNFVDQCLKSSYIGRDHIPDILNIGLYAGNYDHQNVVKYPSEIQDTYVRLDRVLAHIFELAERLIGKERVLFVISSTGYADNPADDIDFAKLHIPSGTFSMSRASMLLNMYLGATFGQAQWVEGTHNCQFYLNHKLIEQKQLKLADVLARAEECLSQMSGVRDVYTSQRLSLGIWSKGLDRIRAGWNINCSGDILIEVNPGWKIVNENLTEYVNGGEAYLSFPLFFLGSNIVKARLAEPVSMAAIAPTLARCLRIRAPNGSTVAPLVLQ